MTLKPLRRGILREKIRLHPATPTKSDGIARAALLPGIVRTLEILLKTASEDQRCANVKVLITFIWDAL